jgi:D-ribose pyranase
MKKTGLLHGELSHLVAMLGHGDAVVVADAGLPVPPGVRCIDLAVSRGVPSFDAVLQALLGEMQVERACLALELAARDPAAAAALKARLPDAQWASVSHHEFKQASHTARAIIRTGEFTPYMNVMLFAGVVF